MPYNPEYPTYFTYPNINRMDGIKTSNSHTRRTKRVMEAKAQVNGWIKRHSSKGRTYYVKYSKGRILVGYHDDSNDGFFTFKSYTRRQ